PDLREALARVARFENALRRSHGHRLRIVRVHGKRMRVAFAPSHRGALPYEAVVERAVEAGPIHPRIGRRIPDVDVVSVPAVRHDVEIALAFEPELVPARAAVLAAQQAEGIHQSGAGGRVAAAVDVLRSSREPYVVVRRSRRLRPFAVFINGESVMAG